MADFLTQAWPFAAAVLVVLGAVALVVLIVILIRAAKAMGHVANMAEEAEKELTPTMKRIDPMMERAELTVDTINLELLRVDAILEDVEQITNVAGKTADTVNAVTAAPTEAVTNIFDRVRGAIGTKKKTQEKTERFVYPIGAGESKPAAPAPAAEAVEEPAQPAEQPVAEPETINEPVEHQGKHSVSSQPVADEAKAEESAN